MKGSNLPPTDQESVALPTELMARYYPSRSTRFERATYGFEVRCSIQLSYERLPGNN